MSRTHRDTAGCVAGFLLMAMSAGVVGLLVIWAWSLLDSILHQLPA